MIIVMQQQPHGRKDTKLAPTTTPFEFISSDGAGRPSKTSRKTIRSHVMRGKNRAKRTDLHRDPHINLDLSGLNTTDAAPARSSRSTSSEGSDECFSSCTNTLDLRPRRGELQNASWKQPQAWNDGPPSHLVDPLSVPSYGHWGDLAMVNFAAKADRRSQYVIFKFFTSFKMSMYPVEQSFHIAEFKSDWFNWLLVNPTFFHASVFAYSVLEESMAGKSGLDPLIHASPDSRPISDRALGHLGQALRMLQADLVDNERWDLDSTVAVVVCMITVAQIGGDDASFEAHYAALRNIINLRGGPAILLTSPSNFFKVLRIDLARHAMTGAPPRFNVGETSWTSIFDGNIILSAELKDPITSTPPISPNIDAFLQTIDTKLRTLFHDMRRFATAADAFMTSTPKLTFDFFLTAIRSFHARLLSLSYPLDKTLQEPLRVGLLAFFTGLMAQTAFSKIRYAYLQTRLRACIDAMPHTLPDLKLWLLFVGALSVFDVRDGWIAESVKELIGSFQPWQEVRRRLEGVMWVETIHDVPARRVFSLARRSSVVMATLPWKMSM